MGEAAGVGRRPGTNGGTREGVALLGTPAGGVTRAPPTPLAPARDSAARSIDPAVAPIAVVREDAVVRLAAS